MEQPNNIQYLIAPFLGWLIAQFIKVVMTLRKDGLQWADTIQSGGMPSSHTSFMIALAVIIGMNTGFDSIYFAVTFAVTCIIMYDATGVRRTTGEQTEAIRGLYQKQKTKAPKIHNARGHSPLEVFAGVFVGVAAALLTSVIV